jgi:hypothetical protein
LPGLTRQSIEKKAAGESLPFFAVEMVSLLRSAARRWPCAQDNRPFPY